MGKHPDTITKEKNIYTHNYFILSALTYAETSDLFRKSLTAFKILETENFLKVF